MPKKKPFAMYFADEEFYCQIRHSERKQGETGYDSVG